MISPPSALARYPWQVADFEPSRYEAGPGRTRSQRFARSRAASKTPGGSACPVPVVVSMASRRNPRLGQGQEATWTSTGEVLVGVDPGEPVTVDHAQLVAWAPIARTYRPGSVACGCPVGRSSKPVPSPPTVGHPAGCHKEVDEGMYQVDDHFTARKARQAQPEQSYGYACGAFAQSAQTSVIRLK